MTAPVHAMPAEDRPADRPFALASVNEDAAVALAMLKASEEPVTIEELRMAGVYAPAQALYELQLAGYQIERVSPQVPHTLSGNGYRLVKRTRTGQRPAADDDSRSGGEW